MSPFLFLFSSLEALEAIQADGISVKNQWLSILDADVRESHERLYNVKVPAKGDFDVCGHPAPDPGHHSLPPQERIRCRCTVVGDVG